MAEIVIDNREMKASAQIISLLAVEDGETISTGNFTFTKTSYGQEMIDSLLVAGIYTPVEYRRGGNVRKMLSYMHDYAQEHDIAVSLLHPFSFSYYRMFGYEKVADHLMIRCPLRMIDFVPRRCLFQPYNESMYLDLVSVYERFAKGRNLLLMKNEIKVYNRDRQSVYICYDGSEPTAYIIYSTDQNLDVNHYVEGVITVHEIAYTSPSALLEIFSFLRMFEGEFDTLAFANCAACPEVDLLLKHYTHTSYRLLPDLMAKVLNTEKMLSMQEYPVKEGEFILRVVDEMPTVAGTYKVEYGGAESRVTRLADPACPTITMNASALARTIYGYDGLNSAVARYIDGVQIEGDCEEFFQAFPKKPCGMFEHF